jgi:hypothetical protein
MLRYILAGLMFAAPAAAATQGLTLVSRPPVYQQGESAQGMFVGQEGMQLQLRQYARRGPDQQMYVLVALTDDGGNVLVRLIFDPRTWRAQSIGEKESGKIASVSCSPEELYPITLGKVFQCEGVVETNGRALNSRVRLEFNSAERDKQGRLVEFCARLEQDNGEMNIVGRLCWSPDGKWFRSASILKRVRRREI